MEARKKVGFDPRSFLERERYHAERDAAKLEKEIRNESRSARRSSHQLHHEKHKRHKRRSSGEAGEGHAPLAHRPFQDVLRPT